MPARYCELITYLYVVMNLYKKNIYKEKMFQFIIISKKNYKVKLLTSIILKK